MITTDSLTIDTDMVHGKLFIVTPPGIVIDTDGLNLTYSNSSSTRGTSLPIPDSASSSSESFSTRKSSSSKLDVATGVDAANTWALSRLSQR